MERKLVKNTLKIYGPNVGVLEGPYEIYAEFTDGLKGRIGWKGKTAYNTMEEAKLAMNDMIENSKYISDPNE